MGNKNNIHYLLQQREKNTFKSTKIIFSQCVKEHYRHYTSIAVAVYYCETIIHFNVCSH